MHPNPGRSQKKGFTLIELLIVVAIIGLLAVAVAPAFNAIASSNGVGQGAYDVAGLLEHARTEAVARQTYVWVGFQNTNNAGSPEIIAGATYSKDGSGTNTQTNNLQGLSRTIHVRNVKLVDWNTIKQPTRDLLADEVTGKNATPASVSTNSSGVSFKLGPANFSAKQTISFTPTGEATLVGAVTQDEGFAPLIDVSFQQSKGSTIPPNAEEASIVVDGATGSVHILRIK